MILDDAPKTKAADLLRACCGASKWVDGMLAHRPFGTPDAVMKAADEVWNGLTETDWLEAFDHHPRIGAKQAAIAQDRRGSFWSEKEQAKAAKGGAKVLSELEKVNENYERRFGFIYIVCATGKTAEELLEIAQSRLTHERHAEVLVAAEEQRKITQLRLKKLLDEPAAA